jgi:hypothetical protein
MGAKAKGGGNSNSSLYWTVTRHFVLESDLKIPRGWHVISSIAETRAKRGPKVMPLRC